MNPKNLELIKEYTVKKSNYAKYKEERENAIIVEDEYGFASAVEYENHMYIDEIYVIPEERKNNRASTYADKIAYIALEKGYKKLLGSIDPKANGSTTSMKVLLAYGFKLLCVDNNLIYLEKQIGE